MVSALLPPGALIERPRVLVARPRPRPARHADRIRPRPSACCSATSTPSSRTPSIARSRTVGERLVGSGAVDMKGGIALALGVMRALAAAARGVRRDRPARRQRRGVANRRLRSRPTACRLRRLSLLRGGRARTRRARRGWSARRKAAATMRVTARGLAAHSGSAPERGRNALLALGEAARRIAALNDPGGAERLTAVPTVLHAGDAFNVVPAEGELVCDLRADSLDAFEPLLGALPARSTGSSSRQSSSAAGPGWTPASWSPSACSARRRSCSGDRSSPPSVAGRATPATSLPTWR